MSAQLTSSVLNARNRAKELMKTTSKAVLHNIYPEDFEYYLCVFELVDAKSLKTLSYITLPIMPDNIKMTNQNIQSTSKTSNGVVTIENFSFNPRQISLTGNFGRKMKLVDANFELTQFSNSINSVVSNLKKLNPVSEFNTNVKTGYGMVKLLEKFIEFAKTNSTESPVLLFFYCFAYNYNFLVQPLNFSVSQNRNMNMIWEYDITMTALAPASEILQTDDYKQTLSKYLKRDVIKSGVSSVLQFTKEQTKIASNILQYKIGEKTGLNEGLNRGSQLIKTTIFG